MQLALIGAIVNILTSFVLYLTPGYRWLGILLILPAFVSAMGCLLAQNDMKKIGGWVVIGSSVCFGPLIGLVGIYGGRRLLDSHEEELEDYIHDDDIEPDRE